MSAIQLFDLNGEQRFTGTSVGGGGGSQTLTVATATLTDAQTKALPTTAQTLVAAPGAGLLIVPIYGVLFAHAPNFDGYSNLDAGAEASFAIGNGSNFLDACLAPVTHDPLASLLGGNYNVAEHQAGPSTNPNAIGLDDPGIANPLMLRLTNGAAGNLTGGNAANSLVVTVAYLTLTP